MDRRTKISKDEFIKQMQAKFAPAMNDVAEPASASLKKTLIRDHYANDQRTTKKWPG